jgi:hypothetical protein
MTQHPKQSSSVGALRLLVCLLALAAVPATANAYIDPGTGSVVFQSLLALLFGAGVAFRKVREWTGRFRDFILHRPRPDDRVDK